jgi:hypothetical protein
MIYLFFSAVVVQKPEFLNNFTNVSRDLGEVPWDRSFTQIFKEITMKRLQKTAKWFAGFALAAAVLGSTIGCGGGTKGGTGQSPSGGGG